MVPPAFRSSPALRGLHVAAVGLTISAATSVFLGQTLEAPFVATSLPTLAVGATWSWLLGAGCPRPRMKRRWLASIPLAAINGALSCGLAMALTDGGVGVPLGRALEGALVGGTFGAIVWVPALVFTVALLGVPIAWALELARQGLTGEDEGHTLVGAVSAVLSVFTLAGAVAIPRHAGFAVDDRWPSASWSALAIAAGVATMVLARRREARRRSFLRDVAEGHRAEYRVVDTSERTRLVRITQDAGYRVAETHELICDIDTATGDCKRPTSE